MNGVGSSILSYLHYLTNTQPKELCMHYYVLDPTMLEGSKARLKDPEYIRHDPFHAALAQREIRALDQLLDFYHTLDQADEEELQALDNKIAKITLRIIEYEHVTNDRNLKPLQKILMAEKQHLDQERHSKRD